MSYELESIRVLHRGHVGAGSLAMMTDVTFSNVEVSNRCPLGNGRGRRGAAPTSTFDASQRLLER